MCLNPWPDDKILDQTKLKAFADDNLNVTKMIISIFDRTENIVGKGEIVQAISPFPTMFSKGFFSRRVKSCHCVGMGYDLIVLFFQMYNKVVQRKPRENMCSWFITVTVIDKCESLQHVRYRLRPLPDDIILDWSKFKQIADNILKCIYNGK